MVSVALTRLLLLPVERQIQRLDSIPLLQPHYQPSSLLRIDPPQCSASVLWPCGFCHLVFSLGIGTTGSRSSIQKPETDSRPLYAGCHLPSNQVTGKLVPGDRNAPGFGNNNMVYDASSKGSLSFVSLFHTCSRYSLDTLTPTLTTTALYCSSLGWFEACS